MKINFIYFNFNHSFFQVGNLHSWHACLISSVQPLEFEAHVKNFCQSFFLKPLLKKSTINMNGKRTWEYDVNLSKTSLMKKTSMQRSEIEKGTFYKSSHLVKV